jgi:hypothetical protein
MRRLGALLLAVTTLGCQPQGPRHPELAGRPLYLCCTMHFNPSGDATDANFHRTPGLEADDWLYYESPTVVDHVHFVAGKIASIEHGAAPVQ